MDYLSSRREPRSSNFWNRLGSSSSSGSSSSGSRFGSSRSYEPSTSRYSSTSSLSSYTPSSGSSSYYSSSSLDRYSSNRSRRSVSRDRDVGSSSTPSSSHSRNVDYSLRRSVSREREIPTTLRRSVSREREIPTTIDYRRSVSRDREIPASTTTSVDYSLRRSVSRERELPDHSASRRRSVSRDREISSDTNIGYSLRRSVSRERDLDTSASKPTSGSTNVDYSLRRSVSRERDLPSTSSSRSSGGDYPLRRSVSRERDLPNVSYNVRRSISREREIPSSTESKSLKKQVIKEEEEERAVKQEPVKARYYSCPTIAERRSSLSSEEKENITPRSKRETSIDRYSQDSGSSTGTSYRKTDRGSNLSSSRSWGISSSVSDLSQKGRSGSLGDDYSTRRKSLQFYYDPGKYETPKANKDLTGVRSRYTQNLPEVKEAFISGRRSPLTTSTYRPTVYTPGSPSPLRRSWASGLDSSSYSSSKLDTKKDPKMSSFMAIGRNSVFPDFLTRSSSQSAQQAYSQDSQESGLEGFKQKTLRLFGNSSSQKSSSSSRKDSYSSGSGSPTSSNSQQPNNNSKGSKSGSSNGNGSRNIYRQPHSLTRGNGSQRSNGQSADLRRKYFAQRMMWYSEADEDHIDHPDDRNFQKRHHSDLELGSTGAHTDLLRTDSNQSSQSNNSQDSTTSSSQDRKETRKGIGSSRPSMLKSQSLDYYDHLDYRDSRSMKEKSPSPSGKAGRRLSSSSILSQKFTKQPSIKRQKEKRKTRFSDDVAVVYYDQEEKATALRGADTIHEQEKLKEDKTSSSTVTESTVRLGCTLHPGQMCGYNNLARLLASSNQQPDTKTDEPNKNDANGNQPNDNDKVNKVNNLTSNTVDIDSEGNMVRKSVFTDKTMDIIVVGDSHELKLVVPIGPEFIRNRTSVKATSGGKRLIVIAYRNEGEGDLAHVHQYIEKMTLPHPIDAYSVRATMDREGNLKISAPMCVTSPTDQSNIVTSPTGKTSEEE